MLYPAELPGRRGGCTGGAGWGQGCAWGVLRIDKVCAGKGVACSRAGPLPQRVAPTGGACRAAEAVGLIG